MTPIQRWADLVGRRVFQCPFQTDTPFEPWEGDIGGFDFKPRYAEALSRSVGDPPDKRALWNAIPNELRPLDLFWPEIVRVLDLAPEKMGNNWEVPWDKKNQDFIQSGEVRVKYTASEMPGSTLSRKLGTIPVHYMRKDGKGARVHKGEFEAWARQEYPATNLTDEERGEIADEISADREAMKRSLGRK